MFDLSLLSFDAYIPIAYLLVIKEEYKTTSCMSFAFFKFNDSDNIIHIKAWQSVILYSTDFPSSLFICKSFPELCFLLSHHAITCIWPMHDRVGVGVVGELPTITISLIFVSSIPKVLVETSSQNHIIYSIYHNLSAYN